MAWESEIFTLRIVQEGSMPQLSQNLQSEAPGEGKAEQEVQVGTVQTEMSTIQSLLRSAPLTPSQQSFALAQQKDPEILMFLEKGELPLDEKRARTLVDGMLFYIDPKQDHRKQAVVPSHLRKQLLQENHLSSIGGHFAGKKMYGALVYYW